MPLPELFKADLIDLSPAGEQTLRPLAGPEENVRELRGFAAEMQLHNMWCWAAVGLSERWSNALTMLNCVQVNVMKRYDAKRQVARTALQRFSRS
ncbi:MAG TPA: hypothetical protein VHL59_12700 [Thermoanaerobaculia bacterium]|nr:hypothetical protein [Thermoanaerobaculia bacterium]